MTFYKERYFLAEVKRCLKFISSCSQMFFKIGLFKNFANFTGKHLCWSLFLIKLQAFRSSNLFYRTPPVAASKMFFSSVDMFFMCSLIFPAPRSHYECYKHSLKNIMRIQCKLYLLLAWKQLTFIFGFIWKWILSQHMQRLYFKNYYKEIVILLLNYHRRSSVGVLIKMVKFV